MVTALETADIKSAVQAEFKAVIAQALAHVAIPVPTGALVGLIKSHDFGRDYDHPSSFHMPGVVCTDLGGRGMMFYLAPEEAQRLDQAGCVKLAAKALERFRQADATKLLPQLGLEAPPYLMPQQWLDVAKPNLHYGSAEAPDLDHLQRQLFALEAWNNGSEYERYASSIRLRPREDVQLWNVSSYELMGTQGLWLYVVRGDQAWHLLATNTSWREPLHLHLIPA